jgi:hypothetical protein
MLDLGHVGQPGIGRPVLIVKGGRSAGVEEIAA